MRFKRGFQAVALLLVLAVGLGMAGCKRQEDKGTTVTVVDQTGREVQVPKDVNRVVSGYYISTYMALAMGAVDKLVGIEMKADTRPLYHKVAPQVIELPGVGTAKALNVETVLGLEPDLVILPAWLEETAQQLEDLGLATIVIEPEDLDSLAEAFLLMGKAMGCEERAQAIVDYYEEKVHEVQNLADGKEEKTRVYLAGSEPLRTVSGGMYQHSIIELAGGRNVSAEVGEGYWANVSLEQVLAWDPEVIVLADYSESGIEQLNKDPKWSGVTAVKKGRVLRFPSPIEPWDSPGPSAVLGILWLTHVLNPDVYTQEQFEAEVSTFYGQFYGVDIPLEDLGL